ncbi:MAG: hypothetical protein CMI01_03635 [Oceanospirillaceae bacterium]|nr:hypothetical protein [Oceanospirillaceae bacterium]
MPAPVEGAGRAVNGCRTAVVSPDVCLSKQLNNNAKDSHLQYIFTNYAETTGPLRLELAQTTDSGKRD